MISRSPFDLQPFSTAIVETARGSARPNGLHSAATVRFASSLRRTECRPSTFSILPGSRSRSTVDRHRPRRCSSGSTVHILDVLADPDFKHRECAARRGVQRTVLGVPLLREGVLHRCHLLRADRVAAVHRQADRARHHLRRPGRHRDRECAPVRGGAGAHRRAHRGAGAADGDVRGAAGHQPLGLRPADRARYARPIRSAIVRRRYRDHHASARRLRSPRARCTAYSDEVSRIRPGDSGSAGRGTSRVEPCWKARSFRSRTWSGTRITTWDEAKRTGRFAPLLGVPLVRDGKPIGVMALAAARFGPSSDGRSTLVRPSPIRR